MDFEKMKEMAAEDLKQFRKLQESSDKAEQQKAAAMGKALKMLSEREQEVLREIYIDRDKRFTGFEARLQEKFGICRAGVHRLKNNALCNYCIGIIVIKAAGNKRYRLPHTGRRLSFYLLQTIPNRPFTNT